MRSYFWNERRAHFDFTVPSPPEETGELAPDVTQTIAEDGLETLEPIQTEDENGLTVFDRNKRKG